MRRLHYLQRNLFYILAYNKNGEQTTDQIPLRIKMVSPFFTSLIPFSRDYLFERTKSLLFTELTVSVVKKYLLLNQCVKKKKTDNK